MVLPTLGELQSIADHLRAAQDHLHVVMDHLRDSNHMELVDDKIDEDDWSDDWSDDSLSLLADFADSISILTNEDTPHYMTPPRAREHLVITPISADKTTKARIDYEEQEHRLQGGKPLLWDDSRYNQSREGDLFGFWMYKNQVRIHVVEAVFNPEKRLPSWSSNVGQGSRNVIQLSDRCVILPWSKWLQLDGAKRCMGTAPVKKGLNVIIEFHNERW